MAPVRTLSSMEELARNFVDSNFLQNQKESLERISEIISVRNSTGMLDLVEVLGVYLTSGEVQQRRKSTLLLAELMHRLEPNILNDKESELLALFFIDRLKDHHSIQPQVIYGLLGLISYFSVTDENIISICQALFAEVHIRSLGQADRRNAFNLFSNMLEKYFRPVHKIGCDFVLGFIQSMDGEKDPRNLLVCFQNVQAVVSKLPFEIFVEDLFEVTSCYFPIDFTPPSNDPYGITKEDLVIQLRKCLASTHHFAPFCLPLLLEKITSDIVDAKIDAYLTLAACATVYKPEDFKEYYKDVWSSVRGSYLLGGIIAIENASMAALEGLAIGLSGNNELCKDYIDVILQDCEQALKGPDLNLHSQLGKIILTIVFSCTNIFQITFPRIVQSLGSLITESESSVNATAVLQILHQLLQHEFLQNQNVSLLNNTFASKQSLVAYLLASLSSSDSAISLVCYSYECLRVLLLHGCLSDLDASIFLDSLLGRLNSETDQKVLDSLFKCILFICKSSLELTQQFICDSLLVNVKDSACGKNSADALNKVKLKNNLDAIYLTLQGPDDAVSVADNLVESSSLFKDLKCTHMELLKFMMQVTENFPLAADKLESKFIPVLLQVIEEKEIDYEIWQSTVALLRMVISNLSLQLQSLWINQLAMKFIEEKEVLHEEKFINANRPYFVSSFLCPAKEVMDLLRLQDVIGWLQGQVVLEATDSLSIEYVCKSYASLVNKMPEGTNLQQCLDGTCEFVDRLLAANDISIKIKERSISVLIWITKAVVLRWNDQAPLLLTKLMSLIPSETIGGYICEHMFILIKEFDDCLNSKMHAKRKIMYKQRLIDFVLPKLVGLHKSVNEATKSAISKAISCIFQQLPKQIVQKQLLPLVPLLIHSLSMSDVSVLSSTLSTFNSLDDPAILKSHVTSLIPRLLSLSKAPESMDLRLQAILCLKILGNLPVHAVYPYQKSVIRSLKSCLDDKKRLVRREACKCRNKWFILSQTEK